MAINITNNEKEIELKRNKSTIYVIWQNLSVIIILLIKEVETGVEISTLNYLKLSSPFLTIH